MFSETPFALFHAVTSYSVKSGDVGKVAAGQDGASLETAPSRGQEDVLTEPHGCQGNILALQSAQLCGKSFIISI